MRSLRTTPLEHYTETEASRLGEEAVQVKILSTNISLNRSLSKNDEIFTCVIVGSPSFSMRLIVSASEGPDRPGGSKLFRFVS